ncbi:hypothetical protein MGYG_08726 [Nannizzia gypsea CBS 118893]|uniref:Uncharacterized protein n=1 Tax=Arthroderma gypseum (strain ATCC MYA-4604 / CBS 118893) TaxID=535722 RepID=E4V6T5_ARTGP|nr:hypothetical protein MGYG_08726 [Nannizzia gypsea CBS 118893]EFQ96801.1 hypothetical protein MGYG_08726 [Nannizzia gypsea CBS 118893]
MDADDLLEEGGRGSGLRSDDTLYVRSISFGAAMTVEVLCTDAFLVEEGRTYGNTLFPQQYLLCIAILDIRRIII